jgi:transcriptional regulator with XRE-family HTH domain
MSRVINLKEVRNNHNLTQLKLSRAAGITQVYISTFENGKMPITEEAAKKVYMGFVKSIEEFEYKSPEDLRAAHTASFYKKDIKEFVYELLYEIYVRQTILGFIDDNDRIPHDEECPVIVEYLREKEVIRSAKIDG